MRPSTSRSEGRGRYSTVAVTFSSAIKGPPLSEYLVMGCITARSSAGSAAMRVPGAGDVTVAAVACAWGTSELPSTSRRIRLWYQGRGSSMEEKKFMLS